jgi:hypothetical protein
MLWVDDNRIPLCVSEMKVINKQSLGERRQGETLSDER